MSEKKKLKEGDIFYVYNDYYKRYFFGKILVDIMNRFIKQANEDLLWPLDFFSDCYLVAVYKDIADAPVLKAVNLSFQEVSSTKAVSTAKINMLWSGYITITKISNIKS